MLKNLFIALALLLPFSANAEDLEVKVESFVPNQRIPEQFAYCKYSPAKNEHELTQNISPSVMWNPGPLGTKSYAIVVVDEDVPADFAPANKEGKTISKDAKRRSFYHWGLVGISGNKYSLAQGEGKPETAFGKHTKNDFGNYKYDGPCPPWNDELVHKYRFQVYALDADLRELGLKEKIHTQELVKEIAPHVLAKGETIFTYSTNPNVK